VADLGAGIALAQEAIDGGWAARKIAELAAFRD